jgi:hypothetical protein
MFADPWWFKVFGLVCDLVGAVILAAGLQD